MASRISSHTTRTANFKNSQSSTTAYSSAAANWMGSKPVGQGSSSEPSDTDRIEALSALTRSMSRPLQNRAVAPAATAKAARTASFRSGRSMPMTGLAIWMKPAMTMRSASAPNATSRMWPNISTTAGCAYVSSGGVRV
jgi:hypothetical protein